MKQRVNVPAHLETRKERLLKSDFLRNGIWLDALTKSLHIPTVGSEAREPLLACAAFRYAWAQPVNTTSGRPIRSKRTLGAMSRAERRADPS